MRTTLTLNDNLILILKKKALENNVPFKTMVNQTLQLGLEAMEKPVKYKQKYKTPTRSLHLGTGYDHDKLGQISEEIEDIALVNQNQ
ncbi:MAG: hypothetical protein PF693_10215 [Spirochaetia bacterium]|jgi:hypothetical protein|nr:hypothetical protein [Spirochaetia bacterium]